MCAIGAAVGSADDQPAVGFSLSFPDNAVNPKQRRTIADRVVTAVRRVAVKTGDPGQPPDPVAASETPMKERAGKAPRSGVG
jgi:hypothetical protein